MTKPQYKTRVLKKFILCNKGLTSIEFSLTAVGIALVLSLFLMPIFTNLASSPIESHAFDRSKFNGIDNVVTGGVGGLSGQSRNQSTGGKRVLSITRSILQGPNDPPCIIFTDGSNNGYC